MEEECVLNSGMYKDMQRFPDIDNCGAVKLCKNEGSK